MFTSIAYILKFVNIPATKVAHLYPLDSASIRSYALASRIRAAQFRVTPWEQRGDPTNSHVRQIWLLRGALGLANGPWPEQHWA